MSLLQTPDYRLGTMRDARPLLGTAALSGTLAVFVYAGGLHALAFLAAVGATALLTMLAYRFPLLTIGLWALLAGIAVEVVNIYMRVGGIPPGVAFGSVDVRYSDPILLGIAGALLLRLLFGNRADRRVLMGTCLFWSLLTGWLLWEVARSVEAYGLVSAIGEFRTTFGELLVLPYVVLFVRTREDQHRLLGLLVGLSLTFIVVGIVAGGLLYGFSFAPHDKWLRSEASLALVLGALALYLTYHHGLWRRSPVLLVSLLGLALPLTIISSNRSVWMAAFIALVFLAVVGTIPLSRVLTLVAGLVLCAVILDVLYTQVDLLAFFEERLLAFVAPQQDSTSRWRLQIWANAWEQSQAFLLEGKGFGNYFLLYDARGIPVTVSLHNQYLQIVYQVGLVGLLLYLGLVLHTARALWAACRQSADHFVHLACRTGLTALVTGSAYYVVYGFEAFTWLYVGLGLAVAVSTRLRCA